jgi:hypothetical protein
MNLARMLKKLHRSIILIGIFVFGSARFSADNIPYVVAPLGTAEEYQSIERELIRKISNDPRMKEIPEIHEGFMKGVLLSVNTWRKYYKRNAFDFSPEEFAKAAPGSWRSTSGFLVTLYADADQEARTVFAKVFFWDKSGGPRILGVDNEVMSDEDDHESIARLAYKIVSRMRSVAGTALPPSDGASQQPGKSYRYDTGLTSWMIGGGRIDSVKNSIIQLPNSVSSIGIQKHWFYGVRPFTGISAALNGDFFSNRAGMVNASLGWSLHIVTDSVSATFVVGGGPNYLLAEGVSSRVGGHLWLAFDLHIWLSENIALTLRTPDGRLYFGENSYSTTQFKIGITFSAGKTAKP